MAHVTQHIAYATQKQHGSTQEDGIMSTLMGRACAWVLVFLLAVTAVGEVVARGSSSEESALEVFRQRQAPVALSADGQWRLHVDKDQVLHRVHLSGKGISQQFQLPSATKAKALAASRSGKRVAYMMEHSKCVGMVDFGSDVAGTPSLAFVECKSPWDNHGAVALSSNGRWLATAQHVLDVDTQRVVASFPRSEEPVLSLRFLPGDDRLLVGSAVLPPYAHAPYVPSPLQFSVWSLKSLTPERLISVHDPSLHYPQAYFHAYSTATNALYHVDSRARPKVPVKGKPPDDDSLMLVQTSLGTCKPSWQAVFPIQAWDWQSMVIDPRGRWIAGTGPSTTSEQGGAAHTRGVVEWLEVFDLSTGKLILRKPFQHSVYGLVALHDGSVILGLTGPAIDSSGQVEYAEKAKVGEGELIQVAVPLQTLSAPHTTQEAWEAPCLIEDETPEARSVQRPGPKAKVLWSMPIKVAHSLCRYVEGSRSFVMPDETVWLYETDVIKQLDARIGRVLQRRPAPHKPKVCALPLPPSGGFVSFEGDTLVWRSLAAGEAPAQRKVLERRPGWFVQNAIWNSEAEALLVYWIEKSKTTPSDPSWDLKTMKVAYLHPETLVPLSEVETTIGANEMAADGYPPVYPPCQRAWGSMTSGYDWRVSYFGSYRAFECGPAGQAPRTVLWSHLDIHPKPTLDFDVQPIVWAASEGFAVIEQGLDLIVFDTQQRREAARIKIDRANGAGPVSVFLLPSQSLVMVQHVVARPDPTDSRASDWTNHLTMYSFR